MEEESVLETSDSMSGAHRAPTWGTGSCLDSQVVPSSIKGSRATKTIWCWGFWGLSRGEGSRGAVLLLIYQQQQEDTWPPQSMSFTTLISEESAFYSMITLRTRLNSDMSQSWLSDWWSRVLIHTVALLTPVVWKTPQTCRIVFTCSDLKTVHQRYAFSQKNR